MHVFVAGGTVTEPRLIRTSGSQSRWDRDRPAGAPVTWDSSLSYSLGARGGWLAPPMTRVTWDGIYKGPL